MLKNLKNSWLTSVLFGLSMPLLATQPAHADLSQCRFHFGRPFTGAIPQDQIPQLSYVSQWAGYTEAYNMAGMMQACRPGGRLAGKTPVIYSYIIAFTLRNQFGLQDCNVGTPNLCQQGAQRLRDATVKRKILEVYGNYARGTANDYGTTLPVVWLMEPDFYQYAQPGSQSGNPLSFSEASNLMNELIDAVKAHLPNALFSLDISPWTTDQGQTRNYYTAFNLNRFTFMHTSGGEAQAGGAAGSAKIKNNQMTYSEIFGITQKPILADCGYGVGGASTGHNTAWDDVNNLNNRITDGVIGVNQANPNAQWGTTLSGIRSRLNTPGKCPNIAVTPLKDAKPLLQKERALSAHSLQVMATHPTPTFRDGQERLIEIDGTRLLEMR